jgi:hypothetical protein
MTAIPQHIALRLQVAAIGGNESPSSFIEIRPLDRDQQPVTAKRTFVAVRDLGQAVRRCIELAGTLNVFVGAAPRCREDGTANAVERVWVLWADCDGREALEQLRGFRPAPSIVVRSGSDDCAHAYWPLCQPVPAGWAKRANRRLALALGADLAATDPARILRAAGTLNHKHSPARPVVCTRLELDVFTFDQVVGRLPDDRGYTPPPARADDLRGRRGDPAKSLGGLVRVVRAAAIGSRNQLLFWAACRARDHSDTGRLDLDEAREELRDAAIAVGLGESEIAATLRSALESKAAA